jgi:hypothetical protein
MSSTPRLLVETMRRAAPSRGLQRSLHQVDPGRFRPAPDDVRRSARLTDSALTARAEVTDGGR